MSAGTPIICKIPDEPQGSPDHASAEKGKTVTISDVADFVPTGATLRSQPEGWALVGRPANHVVVAPATTVTARLLGDTAEVRFTPTAFRWEWGDGTGKVTATPGASWQDLGQDELTATATGHVYMHRGAYFGSVTVVYTAAYRYGHGEWHDIPGVVTGPRLDFRTLVVIERTTLVVDP